MSTLFGIDSEVFVSDDDLLLKIINLFLFQLSHLLNHVIAGDEDGVEEARVSKCVHVLYLALEINLTIILGSVLLSLQLPLLIVLLLDIRNE